MKAIPWTSMNWRWTAYRVGDLLLPRTCTAPQAHIVLSVHRLSPPFLTVPQVHRIARSALRTALPHLHFTPIGAFRGVCKGRKEKWELRWNAKMWILQERALTRQEVSCMWQRRVVSPNGPYVVQGNGGGGVDSGLSALFSLCPLPSVDPCTALSLHSFGLVPDSFLFAGSMSQCTLCSSDLI